MNELCRLQHLAPPHTTCRGRCLGGLCWWNWHFRWEKDCEGHSETLLTNIQYLSKVWTHVLIPLSGKLCPNIWPVLYLLTSQRYKSFGPHYCFGIFGTMYQCAFSCVFKCNHFLEYTIYNVFPWTAISVSVWHLSITINFYRHPFKMVKSLKMVVCDSNWQNYKR